MTSLWQHIDETAGKESEFRCCEFKKYNIVVVPTIIVFNGEEVKRYQADLSFTMAVTRKEVQEEVDELIMSDF